MRGEGGREESIRKAKQGGEEGGRESESGKTACGLRRSGQEARKRSALIHFGLRAPARCSPGGAPVPSLLMVRCLPADTPMGCLVGRLLPARYLPMLPLLAC